MRYDLHWLGVPSLLKRPLCPESGSSRRNTQRKYKNMIDNMVAYNMNSLWTLIVHTAGGSVFAREEGEITKCHNRATSLHWSSSFAVMATCHGYVIACLCVAEAKWFSLCLCVLQQAVEWEIDETYRCRKMILAPMLCHDTIMSWVPIEQKDNCARSMAEEVCGVIIRYEASSWHLSIGVGPSRNLVHGRTGNIHRRWSHRIQQCRRHIFLLIVPWGVLSHGTPGFCSCSKFNYVGLVDLASVKIDMNKEIYCTWANMYFIHSSSSMVT